MIGRIDVIDFADWLSASLDESSIIEYKLRLQVNNNYIDCEISGFKMLEISFSMIMEILKEKYKNIVPLREHEQDMP